jgi:hypothetical protein
VVFWTGDQILDWYLGTQVEIKAAAAGLKMKDGN